MNIKSLISNPILLAKAMVTVLTSALLGAIMALVYAGVFIWNVSFLTNPYWIIPMPVDRHLHLLK